jgi:hypothetical protein
MSAMLGTGIPQQLRQVPEHVRLEFGPSTVNEISELYRALAVRCLEMQAARVLVVVGDDEPAGEQALRDALTVMVLVGLPTGFKLALVTASPKVAYTYRLLPRDLPAAGIRTGLFENEEAAKRWLDGEPGRSGP